MPIVTKPKPGEHKKKSDHIFEWDMEEVVNYYSSKVIVGKNPYSSNVYAGKEVKKTEGNEDRSVTHPGDGKPYFTMPCYRKRQSGTWYTLGSDPIPFYSDPG